MCSHVQLCKLVQTSGIPCHVCAPSTSGTLYCEIKKKCFLYFLYLYFRYYLCEKYYKPITVQYYVTGCIS